MTTPAGTDAAPSRRWLRVLLVLVAALEFLDALSGVQNIFTDYHHDTTLLRFAQALTSINLALSPLLAGATAALLALKDQRLPLATLLACLPALFKWIGLVVFFIAIMIYGF